MLVKSSDKGTYHVSCSQHIASRSCIELGVIHDRRHTMELSDDIFKPDMPTDLKATPADLAHLEDLVQRIGWHETLCHVCNLLFEHHAVATGTKKGALKAVARHIGFVLPGVIWCDQELKLHTPEATTNADLTAKSIDLADTARADLLSRVQAQGAAANQAAQQQYDTDSQRDLNDPVILQQNPPPPQSWLQTIAGILGNWTVTSTVVLGAAALLIPGARPVLFAVGVGLWAASTAYSAYDRYFNQGQSGWQALLGGAADATGISAVYTGITGRDLVTQHHLSLTPAQQRQILTEGSIQAVGSALVLYGGVRSFLRGRVPVAPASGEVVPRLGPRGVDPAHHNANVLVRDASGQLRYHERLVSGNMTAEEQALGFPRGMMASHTEARAVRN